MRYAKKCYGVAAIVMALGLLLTACSDGSPSAGPLATVDNASPVNLPAINGASEVAIDPAIVGEFSQSFSRAGLANATVKLYASDLEAAQLATNADSSLVETGYSFGLPGYNKPVAQGASTVGLYTKAGSRDVLLVTSAVPTDATQFNNNFNVSGLSEASSQKLIEAIKGRKSAMFVTVAPNVVKTVLSGNATSAR